MLESLRRLLTSPAPTSAFGGLDLKLAVAALLVEAAGMDDTFDARERQAIEHLLAERFDLDADATAQLVAQAERRIADAVQYHPFAQRICEELSIQERTGVIEMMWSVALADGELDPHEDMLLRQVAGLLHVPDRDRGLARRRALAKRGIVEE